MNFERSLKPGMLDTAKRTMELLEICDNCLGRQFSQISTGMSNRERGGILRKILKTEEPKKCKVCNNFFKNIGRWADRVREKLKGTEFSSFVVGTKMSRDLVFREESLWEEIGIEYTEPMKSEVNRELGKILEKTLQKKADERNPDVNIIINFQRNRTEVNINPLYVYGRYRKLARGIPQTKMEKHKVTVEGIIAKPFINKTRGSGHSFHALGREDIDARCLDWRPFVFEVREPKKRRPDLKKIQREINRSRKIQARDLRFSGRKEVVRIKEMKPDRSYRIVVKFEKGIGDSDLKKLRKISIVRQNPKNLHARADRTREKRVKEIKWRRINNKSIELKIKGEAGLYIKELVTGKGTKPSVAGILKNPARVKELDVIKIHLKG